MFISSRMDLLTFEELPAIYRLPPEILEQIFLDCHHDNSVYALRTETPFNLSSTCVRWRLITLNLSRLWSTFHVNFGHKSCRPALPVLQSWLDRSRTCPLSFSLMYRGPNIFNEKNGFSCTKTSMKNLFAPLEILLEHLPRWRHVYLDFSDLPHNAIFSLWQLPETYSPMILQNFSLRTFEPHPRHSASEPLVPTYMNWISSLAESSPALTRFSVYGKGLITHLSGVNTSHSVPWNRLTTLTLENISWWLALFILQSASSSLARCTFGGLGNFPDWLPSPNLHLRDEILVSAMRMLSIRVGADSDGMDDFWIRLKIPNIRELEVIMDRDRQWHQGSELVAFLRRSGTVVANTTSGSRPGVGAGGLAIGMGLAPHVQLPTNPISTIHGPPIARLVFRNVSMSSSRLSSCAQLLSESLRELVVIDKTKVDDGVLEMLTLPDSVVNQSESGTGTINAGEEAQGKEKPFLCPCLEKITLRRCITASDGVASRMVRSRWSLPSLPTFLSSSNWDSNPNGVIDWRETEFDVDVDAENDLRPQARPKRYPLPEPGSSRPRRLKSVDIEFSDPNHAEDMHQLEEMRGDGLRGCIGIKKGVKLARRKLSVDSNSVPSNVPVLQPPSLWME